MVMTLNQLKRHVKMSIGETMKMKNHWTPRLPEQERIRRIPRVERNKNMKIQDMLSTGVGVLLVLKVEVLVDNIELICWDKRKNDSDRSFRLWFSDTRACRHVSNSDLSGQQVWSNGSYMF